MSSEAKATNDAAPGRRSVLVEAAVATLVDAGRPMSLQQLARAVLHVESGGAHVAERILTPLLDADDRLTTVDAGYWGLAAWSHRSDEIDETEFVVFDIETNGGRGGRHRVLEVGALRMRAGPGTLALCLTGPRAGSRVQVRYALHGHHGRNAD